MTRISSLSVTRSLVVFGAFGACWGLLGLLERLERLELLGGVICRNLQ